MYDNTRPEGIYIFLFGLGFLMGYLISLKTLDGVYKDIMKRALDEVHRQYKRALGKGN
jgi:hypothetical protein